MCAWFCSAQSKSGLMQNLYNAQIINTSRIALAFLEVDRRIFVPQNLPDSMAYSDSPQPIGHGATISAPHMHASVLEALNWFLLPGSRFLDVGSGSGAMLAYMSKLIEPTGVVVGIDHVPELVETAKRQLTVYDPERIKSGQIICKVGDGRLGAPELGPFSAIHVGAACKEIPQALIDQLSLPGRMIIPIEQEGLGYQSLIQVDKDDNGQITKTKLQDVRFVPLTDLDHQLKSSS